MGDERVMKSKIERNRRALGKKADDAGAKTAALFNKVAYASDMDELYKRYGTVGHCHDGIIVATDKEE